MAVTAAAGSLSEARPLNENNRQCCRGVLVAAEALPKNATGRCSVIIVQQLAAILLADGPTARGMNSSSEQPMRCEEEGGICRT